MVSDTDGFRSFAEARLPKLYRSALALCGNTHTAEDLVQEALTRVFMAWGTRRIDDPVAYTQATLTNVFLAGRRRRSSREYPTETLPDGGGTEVDLTLRLDLYRALQELKPLDRAIVVLRYLEDLPVDEVAAMVKQSPGNVRVRASRSLPRLRDLLAEFHESTTPIATQGSPEVTCRD
ncbi:SigE family RNA polymerase sigma factor [Nocardioides hungaricus]